MSRKSTARNAGPPELPAELVAAHAYLIELLDKAIAEFEQRKRIGNVDGLYRAGQRFVAQLVRTMPGAHDELLRRADFVRSATGPNSEYCQAADAVRQALPESLEEFSAEMAKKVEAKGDAGAGMVTRNDSWWHFDHEVRQALDTDLSSLARVQKLVSDVRGYIVFASGFPQVPSLKRLLDVLQSVHATAPRGADGCKLLLRMHTHGAEPVEQFLADCHGESGGLDELVAEDLRPMRALADDVMSWVARCSVSGPKAPPKPRGRPKADFETVQREAEVAAEWERAHEKEVRKDEFVMDRKAALAKDGINDVDDLDRLLDRVAKRKKPSE
jgi:hypothetical protein